MFLKSNVGITFILLVIFQDGNLGLLDLPYIGL